MTPSACWILLDASDYLCNKQEIQRFSPFQFFIIIRWYVLQKAQRDIDCSRDVGNKMNGEPSKAHIKVATAAANEGQRRSMYNKNNRFLVK